MKNELLRLGPFTVHGYGLMIAIGVIAAFLTAEYRAKKYHLDPERIFSITIWCLIGGMAGAKILYCLTRLPEIMKDPSILLNLSDGFVVYGGIIGGILVGYIYSRKTKLDFLKYFDLVMPSIALAQGFGRLGCLLAGCCYGTETQSRLGIVFHESHYAPNGIRLVPTQIISSGLDFLLFFLLIFFAKKKTADGQVACLYLICYSAGRFVLEFFRGDLIRGSVGTLSTSQFIAILMLAAGALLLFISTKSAKKGRG